MRRASAPLLAALLVAPLGCGGRHHAPAEPDVNGCVPVRPASTSARTRPKPTTTLDRALKFDVTFTTNCGEFTVRLDPQQSPHAAASMAALVQSGFYDGTTFFKIVPTYVQGGDPTATGTGGPGYTTVDPPPADARYTHGVIAMAKTGVQRPGTAGSQFFVVTAADAGLTPDYAIVGTVVQGLDVVDRIGKLAGQNGQPTETVEIQHASFASFK